MEEEKISRTQLMALLWAGVMAPAAELLPALLLSGAGKGAWLAVVLAAPLVLAAARPIVRGIRAKRGRGPKERQPWEPRSAWGRQADRIVQSVDFAFFCMLHPFKGFYELKAEKQGTMAGATVLLMLYIASSLLRGTLSGYLFGGSADQNPIMMLMTVCLPVALFVLANWCITTLMEGEGRMRDIYQAVCYALMPMILGQIVLIVLSNLLTLDEASVYSVISGGLLVYTVFLLLAGNMQAHGFTMGRTVGAAIVTVIAMAVITCIYVVLGGYMATVMNDFIQGIVMLLGITAVIVAVILNNGGFTEAVTQLSYISSPDSAMAGPFVSFFGPDLLNLLGVVVLTSLGTWGLPQMVQKFYAIKSGPAVKQGAIISTVFAFVVAGGSYFLGGFGRLYSGQIEYAANGTPVYDSIIPTMLSTLPDVLIGLVIVLVLSASMSTLSSLVLTSSSTLTIDLIQGNVVKEMSEKQKIGYMRVLLVVFVVISAGIALLQYHSSIVFIAQLMGYSWGALAGAFLGPFLWGLYSGRISKAAVWCSFAIGVGLTAVNMVMGFAGTPLIASPINCGALCMILSLAVVPLVSLVTKRVPFEVDPPSAMGAVDKEYEREVAEEERLEGAGAATF